MDIGHASKDSFALEHLNSATLCAAFHYELVSLISNNGFQGDPNDADVLKHFGIQLAIAFTLDQCADNELKVVQGNNRVKVYLELEQQKTFILLFPRLVEAQLKFNAQLKSEPDNQKIRIKLNGNLNSEYDFFVEKRVSDGKKQIWLTYLKKSENPEKKTQKLMFLATPDQFDKPIDSGDELFCGEPVLPYAEQGPELPQVAVPETVKSKVLILPSPPFSEENRRALCSAVFNKDEKKVRTLLDQMPDLINAQPKTEAGNSLLHIAALNNDKSMCQLLFDKGHETNLVNEKGETPYQLAKQKATRQLLVARHKEALCIELYTVSKTSDLVQVVSCRNFSRFLKTLPQHTYANTRISIFSFTTLNVSAFFDNQESVRRIKTYLREKIFMMPFYGELIVRHENDEAELLIQLSNHCAAQKGALIAAMETTKRMFLVQDICYFHRLLVKAIKVFPSAGEQIEQSDTPDSIEMKKMFIAFVVHPLVTHFFACPEADKNFINEHFSSVASDIESQLQKYGHDRGFIDRIHKEMCSKLAL